MKLFLVIIRLHGDTTVFLCFKNNLVQENIMLNNVDGINGYILYSDENELFGEKFMKCIFKIPYWVYIISILMYCLLLLKKKN